MQYRIRLAAIIVCFMILTGCAHRAPYEEASDPLESVNRAVYKFNDSLDRNVLKPVAQGYQKVIPSPVRKGVRNFFSNLGEPLTIVNDLLQGKPTVMLSDIMRFSFNSTFGIGGLIDVATGWDLPEHKEDFGQTLATWGVGGGWYLMLPFLGPSNVRDTLALPFNTSLDPLVYTEPVTRFPAGIIRVVSLRAGLLGVSQVLDSAALDPYISVREAYRQVRWNLVYDGDPPEPDFFDEELLP
jgi:phospholipid-binding lipoprotein MlaA